LKIKAVADIVAARKTIILEAKPMKQVLCCCAMLLSFVSARAAGQESAAQWSPEKAAAWYNAQPWLVGADFLPSTAINQLEMWQPESFAPEAIDRELGWAAPSE
jgi:hypothetical protein